MSFCYFDEEAIKESYVLLDSLFIQHYLPYADEAEIKVYIYGLDLCRKTAENVSLATFAGDLNMSETAVKDAFAYWERQGIVRVQDNPFCVNYLSVSKRFGLGRTFKKQKYTDFNRQVEEMFENRVVTPQEFCEYYTIIEDGKLEPEAMVMIIKYCLNYCSSDNPVRYVRKVANAWVESGVRTVADVEKRLMQEEEASSDIRAVLCALGRTGAAEPMDRQLYVKWTAKLGFSKEAVLAAAKTCKKKGGMTRLDEVLSDYLKQGIYTAEDIIALAKRREEMTDIAVRVNSKLGVFYQSLDNEIEVYISKWLNYGYTAEGLVEIADYCFRTERRTLADMDREVDALYRAGYVSGIAVHEKMRDIAETDRAIQRVIAATGSNRRVRESDRAYYANWLAWGFDEEVILQAAALAVNKPYATAYINQVLGGWKQNGTPMETAQRSEKAQAQERAAMKEEELLARLRKDKEYASLEKERRKLSIELAKTMSEGGVPEQEKMKRYSELETLIAQRREALGL